VGRLPEDEDQEEEDAVHPDARIHGGVSDEDRQRPGDGPGIVPYGERRFQIIVYRTVYPPAASGEEQARRRVEETGRQEERDGDRGKPAAATFRARGPARRRFGG